MNNAEHSNFVTVPGILLLLAGVLVSAYYGIRHLTIFLAAVLLLCLAAWLWNRASLKDLTAELTGNSVQIFPGEEGTFSLTVRNRKHLPMLWLEASAFDQVPTFLADPRRNDPAPSRNDPSQPLNDPSQPLNDPSFSVNDPSLQSDPSQPPFLAHVNWVRGGQSITCPMTYRGISRGVCLLDHVTVRSGDLFGLSEQDCMLPCEDPILLVVYPQVFGVRTEGLIRDTLDMSPGNRGYQTDPTLFRGSRDYQPGDSVRDIDWRVLAAQGRLATRQYETVVPYRITFLMDLTSFCEWKEESTSSGTKTVMTSFHRGELEDMIRLTASCILALTERNVRCSLILPRILREAGAASSGAASSGAASSAAASSSAVSSGTASSGAASSGAASTGAAYYVEMNQQQYLCTPYQLLNTDDITQQVPLLLTALAGLDYSGQTADLPRHAILRAASSLGQICIVGESAAALSCRSLMEQLDDSMLSLLVRTESNRILPYPVHTYAHIKNIDEGI